MGVIRHTADLFAAGAERRRTPRLTLEPPLHGEVLGTNATIEIADISARGLGVQSKTPFWPDSQHVLRVTAGTDANVDLLCRVIHCRRAVTDGGAPCYAVGWAFLPSQSTDEAVTRLMDLLAGSGPFDLVS